MQTIIYSKDFALTDALESFIRQRANKTMNICSDQIERLTVRLKDINGPKGGDDKECCVEVKLAKLPAIVVSKRSADAYSSIHRALGRAARTTMRRLSKHRAKKTSPSSFTDPVDQATNIFSNTN